MINDPSRLDGVAQTLQRQSTERAVNGLNDIPFANDTENGPIYFTSMAIVIRHGIYRVKSSS